MHQGAHPGPEVNQPFYQLTAHNTSGAGYQNLFSNPMPDKN
jgi:hypothetical protein